MHGGEIICSQVKKDIMLETIGEGFDLVYIVNKFWHLSWKMSMSLWAKGMEKDILDRKKHIQFQEIA